MKVAFIAHAGSWHTIRWYDALRDRIDLKVYSFHSGSGSIGGDGIVVLESSFPSKLNYLFSVDILREKLDEFMPDIIHAHYATGYGYLGSRVGRKPFVVSVWGSDIFDFPYKSFLHRRLLRSVLSRADAVCATSNSLKRGTLKIFPELKGKVRVIPFGIDTDLFSPADGKKSEDRIVIGVAKILDKIYRIDLLMKVFDNLAGVHDNLYLQIAGDGPLRDELHELRDSLKHADRIEFLGQIENYKLPEFLWSLDIYAIPSKFESYGVAAMEASACGIPVVAFNVGGLSEIVENGENGFLVGDDDVGEFQRSLKKLIEDPELRAKMGRRAREIALQKADIHEAADKLMELYESLLA